MCWLKTLGDIEACLPADVKTQCSSTPLLIFTKSPKLYYFNTLHIHGINTSTHTKDLNILIKKYKLIKFQYPSYIKSEKQQKPFRSNYFTNFNKGEKIMSSLIWVCWQALKNTCTSCKILSLNYINKLQHLCRKVHKQIQKRSLGKILLKGRKLRKTGQNHSPELISPPSKIPVKSLVQLTGTGAASQVYINCIQDRQWLKKSAQLLFERTLSSHICPITTVQNVLKQKLHNPVWPAIWEFKDKEHFSA